jgi:integrase/recombinase XerD
MTSVAPLIAAFLRVHLPRERGMSPNTCETYAHAFKIFFEFVAGRLSKKPSQIYFEELDAKMILEFLSDIEMSRKNMASTRNSRLAAIKAFMRFVEFKMPSALAQTAQVLAIASKRHDQPLIKHLTMDEINSILNAPDLSTRLGIRDRAMLHLCFACGLRVSELVELPLEHLSLKQASSVRIIGKGRRERCLPLWKATAKDLRAWLAVRGGVGAPELFVNADATAMSRAGFEYILDKHVRVAANKTPSLKNRNITPHQLRHSCALVMLQATRDIRKVSLWLGHADLRTTELYLRVDPSEKHEAIEAVVPPSLQRGRFKAPDDLIASLMQ